MLIRISLIVAIIAGLAVGGLNFVKVKEKITTLQANLAEQTRLKETALSDLAKTRSDLKKTSDTLKQTQTTLAATTDERDKALKDLDTQTKRANKLTDDLAKSNGERDDAQRELARYTATGVTPERIVAMDKEYKTMQKNLDGMQAENKLLGEKVTDLSTQLKRIFNQDEPVYLPARLAGKVLVTDPKWNFVVLNVGRDQGVLRDGELLVNRGGKLVAKVIVKSIQRDRCIANVMPGWQLGDIFEGDSVIPAHPAS